MNSMKLSAVAVALGLSTDVQQLDSILNVADKFKYESNSTVFSQLVNNNSPIVVNGFPIFLEETDDLGFKIFQAGLMHYNYQIITLFIIAVDSTQAKNMADKFHSQINIQANSEYPKNGEFKKHFSEDDVSLDEVVNIGKTAKVVYTMFMASV